MRSVWSLWTKPLKAHRKLAWISLEHYLFSWVLSVETAKRHYPDTCLLTDDDGARMLIDGIGLEFNHVSTELNSLKNHDPGWWAFGKLYAYRKQTKPFIHIDSDVYLWKAIPGRMNRAPVFAQNPEFFSGEMSCYRPQEFEYAINTVSNGWIPEEWRWYRSAGVSQKGICCGIFGGVKMDFINYYADTAIRLIEDPHNNRGWTFLSEKIGNNVLFEQYMLSACIEYHRQKGDSPYRDIYIEYLFGSWEDAYVPQNAARAGYTHLLGDAKKNSDIVGRLEKRIMRDYHSYYEKCIDYVNSCRE